MFTGIIIAIIVLVVIVIVSSIANGNLSFWKLAARKPELVFSIMLYDDENDVWVIDGESPDIWKGLNKDDYSGPFRLHVPSLNKVYKIYGKADKIEQEQERIMKKIGNKE